MADAALFEPATESALLANAFPVMLDLRPVIAMTDAQFFEFCETNRELRIEQNATGEVLVMPPAGGETGFRNIRTSRRLDEWAEQDGTGVAFDSSTGFVLPNGAKRSPDGAWVTRQRLAALTPEQKQRFLPLCPDFVMELRSPSDSLPPLQAKMEEYRANGARLGWLIDPVDQKVMIYRNGETEPEVMEKPMSISAETVLAGFVLNLERIWNPDF